MTQPLKAYKYVSLKHAAAVAKGQFWIGTAASYANMEGPRQDALDSRTLAGHGPVAFYAGAVNDGRERMREVGISIGPKATVIASANFGIQQSPWAFVLCFSENAENKHLWEQEDQAIFEISDLSMLADRLRAANEKRLGPGHAGPVKYGKNTYDLLSQQRIAPSPFLKGERFSEEKELRVVWPPVAGAYEPKGFQSAPIDVVGLIKRLA